MADDGTNTLYFTYDASGTPLALIYNNSLYYYYVTNVQGDVIALVDSTGATVVEYTYDAWGNILTTTGLFANTIGTQNPLRYRGYVYDTETGLYYLQSRYYSPEMGRFINADSFASTGQGLLGNNMFAYCGNNPVIYKDDSGTRYCAATTVAGESVKERSESCQHQQTITYRGSLRDVTDEVNSALLPAASEAHNYRAVTDFLLGDNVLGLGVTYLEFYDLVNHEAPWDIKRQKSWESTIGTPYPGFNKKVVYAGTVMTPENLGNYTYGFLGYAYGIPIEHLILGSYYAAGFPTEGSLLGNEIFDWFFVAMGYETAVKIFE